MEPSPRSSYGAPTAELTRPVRDKQVWLGFDCVSSRADAVLAQDYRTITHGAALAVAEELGCVNDGGCPWRRPVCRSATAG